MTPISIVIADDHPAYRKGLSSQLGASGEIEVIGEASNGRELLEVVEECQPQVVLSDIQMDKMSGIESTAILKEKFPHIPVVVLSGYSDNHSVIQVLRAGAVGYVVKTEEIEIIIEAIRAAQMGQNYYSETASRVLNALVRKGLFDPKTMEMCGLTARELSVIQMICDGLTNSQIADKLKTTLEAVKSCRKAIYRKTDTSSTSQIYGFALKYGIYRSE